jgi:chemotaxis protein MotB
MSAGGGGSRKGKRGAEGYHPDERWLLTYSDLITLLMALFIILWAMSTTSADKFDALKQSLANALGSPLFVGQTSVMDGASGAKEKVEPVTPQDASESEAAQRRQSAAAAAANELEDLARVKAEVDAYASTQGLSGKITTGIDERGLVIRILPDDMLFDTGEADLRPEARPVLDKLVGIVSSLRYDNPIRIEGNTDDVPISTPRFRNNFELSTGRAVTVLTVFLEDGVASGRLSAAGYADTRPVDTNETPEGRSLNRRVEVVIVRKASAPEATAAGEAGADDFGSVIGPDGIAGAGISPLGDIVVAP